MGGGGGGGGGRLSEGAIHTLSGFPSGLEHAVDFSPLLCSYGCALEDAARRHTQSHNCIILGYASSYLVKLLRYLITLSVPT